MIYIIVLLCIIAIILVFLIHRRSRNRSDFSNDFQNEVKKLSENFKEKKRNEILRRSNEIEQEINSIQQELDNKKNNFLIEQERLKANLDEQIKFYNEQLKTCQDTNASKLFEEQQKLTHKLQETIFAYNERFEDAKQSHENAILELEQNLAAKQQLYQEEEQLLQDKINQKKIEVDNLIEQFKRDEESRREADFYRIPIDSAAKSDIEKLKSVAIQLSNPSTLYKLIWKDFYEKGFNAMIGRVLGDDKDGIGIYKITNIQNQMVYIGQTKAGFKNRWRTHCKRACKAEEGTSNRLYQEMFDVGLENFTFQVIEKCTEEKLTEREKFWIKFYNSCDFGYNSKT